MPHITPLEPSVTAIASAMMRHWLACTFCIIFGLMLALIAYFVVSPSYEATASLVIGQGGADEKDDKAYRAEAVATLARVGESDEVIRAAINRVGMGTLNMDELDKKTTSIGGRIRSYIRYISGSEVNAVSFPSYTALDFAVSRLGKLTSVKTDPNSSVIRITFKFRDPAVASLFANALATSVIERQISLLDRPGAFEFFNKQATQFGAEVSRSARELDEFMRKQGAYSVEEQRSLLLKRRSDLEAARSSAGNSLAEKRAQKVALVSHLRLLKPVTQSSYVSGLVETLSGNNRVQSQAQGEIRDQALQAPPLLMVKVYQENMVDLFKYNSEIAGLESLIGASQDEINKVDGELQALARRQADFDRLKRNVDLATYNADLYIKRATEEKINASLRDAKLSNVRILQAATPPLRPNSPKALLFIAGGLILGFASAVGYALVLEIFKSPARSRDIRKNIA